LALHFPWKKNNVLRFLFLDANNNANVFCVSVAVWRFSMGPAHRSVLVGCCGSDPAIANGSDGLSCPSTADSDSSAAATTTTTASKSTAKHVSTCWPGMMVRAPFVVQQQQQQQRQVAVVKQEVLVLNEQVTSCAVGVKMEQEESEHSPSTKRHQLQQSQQL
jgi:hypothetical protein